VAIRRVRRVDEGLDVSCFFPFSSGVTITSQHRHTKAKGIPVKEATTEVRKKKACKQVDASGSKQRQRTQVIKSKGGHAAFENRIIEQPVHKKQTENKTNCKPKRSNDKQKSMRVHGTHVTQSAVQQRGRATGTKQS
jgi:hypothetical protein